MPETGGFQAGLDPWKETGPSGPENGLDALVAIFLEILDFFRLRELGKDG